MADGDLIPKQFPFPAHFAPYPLDLTRGSMMVNCYKETRGEEVWCVRRGGIGGLRNLTAFGSYGQGLVVFDLFLHSTGVDHGPIRVYAIVGQTLCDVLGIGGDLGLPGTPQGLYFTFVPFSNVPTEVGAIIAMCLGLTVLWQVTYSTGNVLTLTPISTAGSPTQPCPGGAFLDGTLYIMSITDNQIHGSGLQDMTSWNALNVVGASTSWGKGVACCRHLNYVLGFYEYGLQVYYDAGLAPPGSPLAPLPNASFLVGCIQGSSVATAADTTFFAGRSAAGNYSVYALSGLSLSIVSNSVVDNFLKENLVLFRLQARDEAPWAPQVFGMLYSDKGHNFYLLKVGGTTLAYDTGEGEWSIFSSFITGANSALTDFHPSFVSRDYTIGDDAIAGLVNGTSNVEYSGPIQGLVRTANMDFGNAWKKYIQKISFWGEQVQDSFSVRYTNDDYQTYSNSMAVDMSKIRMMINRQGSCYRRAYEFTYNGTLSWRMRMFEFQIRGGSN